MERFANFIRLRCRGRANDQDLFRIAIGIAHDATVGLFDFEKTEHVGHAHLVLDIARGLRAALRRGEPLGQRELHEVFALRKRERHAADVGEPIVQAVGDAEMRRRLIGENVRIADHGEGDVFFQRGAIDAMGELQRRHHLPNRGISRILIKLKALDRARERRGGQLHFVPLEQDAFRKKVLLESDAIFLIGRPIVLRLEGELRIGSPRPLAFRRRLEMDSARNFFADLFEPGDRAAETNGQRRRLEILLQLRDRNRIGDGRDAQRFRARLIPMPAPPSAAGEEREDEEQRRAERAMRSDRTAAPREPGRRRPGELAEQKCEEACEHKWIGYCGEYGARSEVLSTIYKKLRAVSAMPVGELHDRSPQARRSAERDLANAFRAFFRRDASISNCEV